MNNMAIVPYESTTAVIPYGEAMPGQKQGIFFTMPEANFEWMLEKIRGWFAGREEVRLVDFGYSDKRGLGYIIMEWIGREVDPLFAAILRDEPFIDDYTVYTRSEEDC